VILFDVMDTLVHEPFQREVPAYFGLSLDELLAQKHPSAWVEFERGVLDEATFLRRFFRDGRSYDERGLVECIRGAYRWIDGMEALLDELAAHGAEMHALSNYPSWYGWIEERLGLSRFLAWSFVSCDTGLRKPDERAFSAALQALALPAAQCLFVDDRASNVAAAQAIGIDAVLFRGASELRGELQGRGFLPRECGLG
jgi:HAD superfamily hydrolase (TIGR01509 family)